MRKIAAVPGVSSVGFGESVPMDGNHWMDPVFAQDRTYAEGDFLRFANSSCVARAFPRRWNPHGCRPRLDLGRDLEAAPVAMVSENLAREYWQVQRNALGKRIRVSSKDDWREIVGVIGDVHDDGMSEDAPTVAYWPPS